MHANQPALQWVSTLTGPPFFRREICPINSKPCSPICRQSFTSSSAISSAVSRAHEIFSVVVAPVAIAASCRSAAQARLTAVGRVARRSAAAAFGWLLSGRASLDATRELVKDFIHLDATRNIAGQFTHLLDGKAQRAIAQAFATESGGYLTRIHESRVTGWIHVFGGRGEGKVNPGLFELAAVFVERPRVGGIVFVRPELRGIDEDRGSNRIAAASRS